MVNNEGGISKKKIVDGAKTVAFRALPIISFGKSEPAQQPAIQPKEQAAYSEARLMIEEPEVKLQTLNPKPHLALGETNPKPQTASPEQRTGLGSLQKIRQQISEQNRSGFNEAKIITEEELHNAWGLFIQQLRSKSNHSAVTNFKGAELKVIDNNAIEITTESEIQKAFIETERSSLIEHIQTYFNNRVLTYQVIVIEKAQDDQPKEEILTRKQQYLKIIEEYPLVKELKERLKLEIE